MGQNPIQKEKLDKRNAEMSQLYPQLTYQEIGDKYNLSKERVRRIIIKVVAPAISGKVKIIKKQKYVIRISKYKSIPAKATNRNNKNYCLSLCGVSNSSRNIRIRNSNNNNSMIGYDSIEDIPEELYIETLLAGDTDDDLKEFEDDEEELDGDDDGSGTDYRGL